MMVENSVGWNTLTSVDSSNRNSKYMRHGFSFVLICLLLLIGDKNAQSAPVTYTFSGTGSGSLGNSPFSDAPFTITSTADTTQITKPTDFFSVPDLTAAIFVSGMGSASFTIPTISVNNQNIPAAGFSAPDQDAAILGVRNPAFATYDLSTSIGPLGGSAIFNAGYQFATTAGNFSLDSVSTVIFEAVVQTVPEPSSFGLLGVATAVLGGCIRQKHRRQ